MLNLKAAAIRILFVAVVLSVIVTIGLLVLLRPPGTHGTLLDYFPSSPGPVVPDANFPAFPLPAGSTVVASTPTNSASASRQAAWTVPASDYAEVLAYYLGLADQRWHLDSFTHNGLGAQFRITDSESIFTAGVLRVLAEDPVRILVTLTGTQPTALLPTLPPSASPPSGFGPGGPKPALTVLPSDFPAVLVPLSSTVADAAPNGAILAATFHSDATLDTLLAYYRGALDVEDDASQVASNGFVLVGTVDGSRWQVVGIVEGGQVTVGVVALS